MIKVSNIMGIDPKPFDPKTYVEDKTFVTDESGTPKRLRLENNIVRWRTVRNPDGSKSVSRFLDKKKQDKCLPKSFLITIIKFFYAGKKE